MVAAASTAISDSTVPSTATDTRERLIRRFQRVRARSTGLVASLSDEDQMIQSLPETSPAKWHLAHTTWFFEHHLLDRHVPGYTAFEDGYSFLFDGHAQRIGGTLPAERRGLLSRPSQAEVQRYRDHVNAAVMRLLRGASDRQLEELERLVILGLHHEMKHQEAMLADIKHALWSLPQQPAYQTAQPPSLAPAMPQKWFVQAAGLVEIGDADSDFAFDHERPSHRVWLDPYSLAGRLVTCGEFRDFINDGGYGNPKLWLAEGWRRVVKEGWRAPLYWERRHGEWQIFTLAGPRPLSEAEPVCHVSFYEAAAFARWAGKRLPLEAEWELFVQDQPVDGNFLQNEGLHPNAASCAEQGPWQMFGDVWEWTASPFAPYPHFRQSHEAFADWNAHLLSGGMTLRGGSCLTPAEHVRATSRFVLKPHARWHMTGIRLAAGV